MPAVTPTKSPRKTSLRQPKTSSPMGVSKAMRRSPKKLHLSVEEARAVELSSFLIQSPIGDRSWADIMDEETSPAPPVKEEVRPSRRKAAPSKTVDTRPKFAREDVKPSRELRSSSKANHDKPLSVDIKPTSVKAKQQSLTSPSGQEENIDDETPTKEMMDRRRSPRKRAYKKEEVEAAHASKTWANIVTGVPAERVRTSSISSGSTTSGMPNRKKPRQSNEIPPYERDDWNTSYGDPKLGWVTDKKVVERRDKELKKGYDSDVYRNYFTSVSRKDRVKDVHPSTPNKWINYPRRSWDTMVRQWRRSLHIWAGESASNVSSLNSSFRSDASEEGDSPQIDGAKENNVVRDLQNPNDLASLLGHYDIDSRRGFAKDDESTLKGTSSGRSPVKGPTDFSASLH